MNKFVFIIGGARSGKSRFSVDLAKDIGKKVLFIATCVPQDEEMRRRISLHKTSRPRRWRTIEEARDVEKRFSKLKNRFDVVILDCLGLLISNLLYDGLSGKTIQKRMKSLALALSKARTAIIVVSNEVGGGIVPENPVARQFRDLVGLSNQLMSRCADTVYVMQTGIPVKIKDARRLKSGKDKKDNRLH